MHKEETYSYSDLSHFIMEAWSTF